nr:protein PIN-LIKES 6 [Tanacetum cinerariifolium]
MYVKLKLNQILQPPIISSILAIFIGCVPFLKGLIFTPDAPLYFFNDSPGRSKLGLRTTAAIIIMQLVFVPPAGLGIVMTTDHLGLLPPDDKMIFISRVCLEFHCL